LISVGLLATNGFYREEAMREKVQTVIDAYCKAARLAKIEVAEDEIDWLIENKGADHTAYAEYKGLNDVKWTQLKTSVRAPLYLIPALVEVLRDIEDCEETVKVVRKVEYKDVTSEGAIDWSTGLQAQGGLM